MDQIEVVKLVQRYVSNLNKDGMNIRTAYLYGSHARDEANEESDIDVLLISDIFDTDDDLVLSKPWLPKYRFDFRIEPIAIGTRRFEKDDVSPILEIVRLEGVSIPVV